MSICNLDYLKSVTPGSNAFPKQIIQLFLNDTPNSIHEIKNGISNSNWQVVYNYAHKIKPSVTMLGLPKELIDVLLLINEYSKTETNTDQITSLVKTLEEGLNEVYIDLQKSLEELN
jgi:HPt (histidine-containing phosphotransfer) domain-containing protein